MTNTPESVLIHLFSAIADFSGIDGISVDETAKAVTITRSWRDYCRQCYMGTVKEEATLTFDELLSVDRSYEGATGDDEWYDSYRVKSLISERFNANRAANRKKGYRYE